jgi:hypothetical protein
LANYSGFVGREQDVTLIPQVKDIFYLSHSLTLDSGYHFEDSFAVLPLLNSEVSQDLAVSLLALRNHFPFFSTEPAKALNTFIFNRPAASYKRSLLPEASIFSPGVRSLLRPVVHGFDLGCIFGLSVALDETCFESNGKGDVILGGITSGFGE